MALPRPETSPIPSALDEEGLDRVARLIAGWQPLADLCFSDLLVVGPVQAVAPSQFVVLGQVRPTTAQTLYPSDLVGSVVEARDRPLVIDALAGTAILSGDLVALGGGERVRVQCIPVRFRGRAIAVVMRETATTSGRRPGELERHYLEVFDRFAHMITAGSFPFARGGDEVDDAPRIGDGVIVLDADRTVQFASPNAISAFHRVGIVAAPQGLDLHALGFGESVVAAAFHNRLPVTDEIERGDTAVLVQAIPLLEDRHVVGGIVIMRDVTDLRRRDRMLLSKDATIREIHHRVKNNLQTIAALLRLQARRLRGGEARDALEESERRIRAIAVVHETLSRETSELVSFDDIVRPLVRVVEETVASPETRIRFTVEGEAGLVPGELATPLAVVLNELMQNAVDHAFPVGPPTGPGEVVTGSVVITLARRDDRLLVDVTDDGIGLPVGFSLGESAGLGLSIVETLVTTELGGSIAMSAEGGTRVRLRIPLDGPSTAGG